DVESGVVVPVLLRRIDAIADEHQPAVLDRDMLLAGTGVDHHVVAEGQARLLATHVDLERSVLVGDGLDHRHVLVPLAVVARLQADPRDLRADVLDALFAAGRAGPASLEGVGGEGLDVAGEVGLADGRLERGAVRGAGSGWRRRGGTGRCVGRLAGGQRERGEKAGGKTLHGGSPASESPDASSPPACRSGARAAIMGSGARDRDASVAPTWAAQRFGGAGVANRIAVAPVILPVRALSWTYSVTSRSNTIGPSTTAPGPITMRGLRPPNEMPRPLSGFSTRRLPLTRAPSPTVTSPDTVSMPPASSVPTMPMLPETVSMSPPTWLPRSTHTSPLTDSRSPETRALRPTSTSPLTLDS